MIESLDVIPDTIDKIGILHFQFCNEFYSRPEYINLRSLKEIYVSKINKSDYFKHDFLAAYYSFLENNIEDELLDFFLKYPNLKYQERIKLRDTTFKKINYYASYKKEKIGQIPLYKCLNDIFGVRLILPRVNENIGAITRLLNDKKNNSKLKWFYYRDKDGYKSFQCYFQQDNKVLPWELQIWDIEDEYNNIKAHIEHEADRNKI